MKYYIQLKPHLIIENVACEENNCLIYTTLLAITCLLLYVVIYIICYYYYTRDWIKKRTLSITLIQNEQFKRS